MTDIINWAVLDITITDLDDAVMVCVTTDIPVHLWTRYTTIEPQHHVVPDTRRGADVGTRIDQCFVAYHDLEQLETGDTLQHCFIFTPFPVCQTVWFFFWGTKNGILTNSATPIFDHHHTEDIPPASQCHALDNIDHGSRDLDPCFHVAHAFTPCSSFIPTRLTLYLKLRDSDISPDWAKIYIWTARDDAHPLTIIGESPTTPISVGREAWLPYTFDLTCPAIHAGHHYAFSHWWSYYPRSRPYKRARKAMATGNTCPPPQDPRDQCWHMDCHNGWTTPCDCSGKAWEPWTGSFPPAYLLEGTPT